MMLVKPLPRWGFLLAKFLVIAFVFAASLGLAGLGAYYYTRLLFEPTSFGAWLAINGLLLVYILVYVALTLFFSTLSRSQVLAGGLSLAVLVLLGLLGSLPTLGKYLPGRLVLWA
jgi:ABC-2 type transport system permease protein